MSKLFFARLSGSQEVPAVSTNAFGLAKFKVSSNDKRMGFRLVLNQLNNFTEAHIHLGERGENGPVVAFLFGPIHPGISVTRGMVDGIITAEDLVGPLEGKSFETLVDLMREEKAYVNVHTVQNPEGEIRGQVERFKKITE
ncbi:CHRD domain-containing protein [Bacillus dakarensis]|uniref:CHRD domain-containing protein n=1 Tax=Robertmurraya dakarensis TaxID=1926278 RepID=UPI000981E051|nr:CHRD domain-containing protein [Bacillus dakarensis]